LECSKSLVLLQIGGFDVPLATALCKTSTKVDQAESQLRVVVPIEEEKKKYKTLGKVLAT
jgi:hypothetical protein